MQSYKLNLIKSKTDNGVNIYRYSGDRHKDIHQWRETEAEAKADIMESWHNFKDTTKGMKEMLKIDEFKKANSFLD